jgi:hypothetical protein
MPTCVIVPTPEQWSFFKSLGEGALVVSPDAAKQFREKHGCDLPAWIEYDFCGESDLMIDLIDDFQEAINRYAAEAIEAWIDGDHDHTGM